MGEQPDEAEHEVGQDSPHSDLDEVRRSHGPVQDAPAWDHWTEVTLAGLHNGLRPLLDYERTLREWLRPALVLALPYLIIGLVWSLTHTDRLARLSGLDLLVSFVGSVVAWPVLLVFTMCA